MTLRPLALTSAALLALALPAASQKLGTLDFPTSDSADAQAHFVTGVLYMHSFEYPSALKEFREAERIDPGFAMAYWGEAMTYTHPVWDQQDADAARAALAKLAPTPAARLARAPTERERAYLHTVDILYGDGTKPARDTAYSAAMAELAAHYPKDAEAQLFYALSLIGLNQGDRDIATYGRAGLIAETVFVHQPGHPGAAHYVIHAYDDPAHASIALNAARAYSRIAPDAPHAQHMTSHIFLALGLWDDVVAANIAATGGHMPGHDMQPGCGHYREWLEYGFLQLGRFRDAGLVLDACWDAPPRGGISGVESLAGMRAAYIVDSREWSGRFATEERVSTDPETQAYFAFGSGYAAAMRRDIPVARRALDLVERDARSAPASSSHYTPILALELRALIRRADGDTVRALEDVRSAAALEDGLPIPFGPPPTIKPPHELLGELLLAVHRPADARAEFELALARTPRRPAALIGLAQAQTALGQDAKAAQTYTLLLQIWHLADPGLPDLAAVRAGAAHE